jgi:hypothetical protein
LDTLAAFTNPPPGTTLIVILESFSLISWANPPACMYHPPPTPPATQVMVTGSNSGFDTSAKEIEPIQILIIKIDNIVFKKYFLKIIIFLLFIYMFKYPLN